MIVVGPGDYRQWDLHISSGEWTVDLMLPTGRFYHFAYVVDDVRETMAVMEEAFGIRWAKVLEGSRGPVHHHQLGVLDVPTVIAFSMDGPPHIELIERRPGTLWDVPGTGLHHAGLWVSDVASASDRLAGLGMPLIAHGTRPDGSMGRNAFHEDGSGALVEILAESLQEPFRVWMSGGDLVVDPDS